MITSAWRIGCQNNTGAASLATDTVSCVADITSVSSTGTLSVTPNVDLLNFTGSIAATGAGSVVWGSTQPAASASWVLEADCHITAMNNGATPTGTMAFWIQFEENGVFPTGLGIPLGALAFTGTAGTQDNNALIRV